MACMTLEGSAQNWVSDSVAMSPGYSSDVYYSLKNKTVLSSPNTTWHLGFQMTPPGPYGNVSVIANHVMGQVKVYPTHLQASTSFSTLALADTATIAVASNEVFNSQESWNYGAFNQMANTSNPFDYSWGTYDLTSHNVTGDSLYLIKQGNKFFKIWIQEYISEPADSVHWTFRIGNLDGSTDDTVKIYRVAGGYTDKLFAYYNANTKFITDREPARTEWDILFTRYKELIPGQPGVHYNVTGVLSNFKTEVTEVVGIPADSAVLDTAASAFSATLNEIGSDWKIFDMSNPPGTWIIRDSLSYFIKTQDSGDYYQLKFTGFSGSSTGMVYFNSRKLVSALSINDASGKPAGALGLYPNPTNNAATLMLDVVKAGTARVLVTDMTGRTVMNAGLTLQKGINAYSLDVSSLNPALYVISIVAEDWKVSERLVVQH